MTTEQTTEKRCHVTYRVDGGQPFTACTDCRDNAFLAGLRQARRVDYVSAMNACSFCGDEAPQPDRRDKLGNALPLPIEGAQRAAIERMAVQAEWDAMDAADYENRAEQRIRELGR